MDYIEIWPNLFRKNEIYMPLLWKIEKWDEIINEILFNEYRLFKIDKNGQNLSKEIWSNEGRKKFCKRLASLINFK